MKAIATSMDAKAVDHGRLQRAARPVAGFGFEQLFTATSQSIAEQEEGPAIAAGPVADQPVALAAGAARSGAEHGADTPDAVDPQDDGDADVDDPSEALADEGDAEDATPAPWVLFGVAQADTATSLVPIAPAAATSLSLGDGKVVTEGHGAVMVTDAQGQAMQPSPLPDPSVAGVMAGDLAVGPDLSMVTVPDVGLPVAAVPEVAAPLAGQELPVPAGLPAGGLTGAADRIAPRLGGLAGMAGPGIAGSGESAEVVLPAGAAMPSAAVPVAAAAGVRAGLNQKPETASAAVLPDLDPAGLDLPVDAELPSVAVRQPALPDADASAKTIPPEAVKPALPVDPAEAILAPLPKVPVAQMTAAVGEKPSGAARGGVVSRMQGPTQPDGAGKAAKTAGDMARSGSEAAFAAVQDIVARADLSRADTSPSAAERAETLATAPLTGRGGASTPLPPAPATVPSALPATIVLNMRQANWGKQLLTQIEGMVSSGQQRIDLSLRPKNLGQIQVSLDLRGDQTSIRIVSETAAAARLLGGAEERLAQLLDQSGYRLSGFSVQEQGTGAQGGHSGQQGQPSPRRGRAVNDANTREESSETLKSSPYGAERGRSTGINMLA